MLAELSPLNINLNSDRFSMFNKERGISRFGVHGEIPANIGEPMWPFKKSETQLNSKVELALSIEHLDKARQYFVVAVLETTMPASHDRQKLMIAMDSLFNKRNPFMQPGSSSVVLGGMMSDDFTNNAYRTAMQSVAAGIANGLFSLPDLMEALKQMRETLENEAKHVRGVAPSDLNPPWDDGI